MRVFVITFENEVYKQWSCEFVFGSFESAKGYLLNQGFVEKNRLFVREDYNWSIYLKAYISPIKVYKE
jgi:hypothetical protein